jgi:hypothetical protein
MKTLLLGGNYVLFKFIPSRFLEYTYTTSIYGFHSKFYLGAVMYEEPKNQIKIKYFSSIYFMAENLYTVPLRCTSCDNVVGELRILRDLRRKGNM